MTAFIDRAPHPVPPSSAIETRRAAAPRAAAMAASALALTALVAACGPTSQGSSQAATTPQGTTSAQPNEAASDAAGAQATIRLANIELSFYQVTAELVKIALEAEGYQVETTQGFHADLYPRMGAGEFDLFVASWLPNGHRDLWQAHGGDLRQLGMLYGDARFFWVVPAAVPQAEVATIADLAKPAVAARMKQRIQSIGEAAGITKLSRQTLAAYGLDAAGYEVAAGDPAAWRGSVESAMATGEWFVAPVWQPLYMMKQYDLRPLGDPKVSMGTADSAFLIGHEQGLAKLTPATRERLARMTLEVEDVSTMDYWVVAEGLSPRAAAERWLQEHRDRAAAWHLP